MRRLLVTVVVLLALAYAADRGARYLAQRELARQIQQHEHLARPPSVHLIGFPFLTQVVRGSYDGARVEMRDVPADRIRLDTLVVDLRGVRLPLSDLVAGKVGAVPVEKITGSAQISYTELAAATDIRGLRIRPRGDKIELQVPLPAGAPVDRLIVTARVGVAGQALRITTGEVQGVPVPQPIVDLALAPLERELTLSRLPYGLHLTGLRVAESGLEVSARATGAVLRPVG